MGSQFAGSHGHRNAIVVSPDRVPLIQSPTPLHRLPRASIELGVDLWIKRDDLTGFALGGNKGRKLEYLIADALASGADAILTCGSAQSNFIRQLGAACAIHHLKCFAVVMDLPFEETQPRKIRLSNEGGNVLLDQLFEVETIHEDDGTWESLFAKTAQLSQELIQQGHKLYQIPIGGSSALGAYSFYQAAREVQNQEPMFDWVTTSTSSGSTLTGLTYGYRNHGTKILGFSADPEPEILDDLAALGEKLADLLGVPPLSRGDFGVNLDFVGHGYGVTDLETLLTISWIAKLEGIILDPIYTGKAFRGMVDLVRKGTIGGKILFWHTGGVPSFFSIKNSFF